MAKSSPITFGKTDEMIFQIIHRAAIPLSTNDVYQRLHSEGVFHEIPAQRARTDIGAKLRKLKTRGVMSRVDPVKGTQLWQLDPDTRAKLPPVTDVRTPIKTNPAIAKLAPDLSELRATPKAKKPTVKTAPATLASVVSVQMPADKAVIWADSLNDLTYHLIIDERIRDMFGAIELIIRNALPQEAA